MFYSDSDGWKWKNGNHVQDDEKFDIDKMESEHKSGPDLVKTNAVNISSKSTALDFFRLFFTKYIVESIISPESLKYAIQKGKGKLLN